jgi:hypothetical protein
LNNNTPKWQSKQEEGKQQLQESKGKLSPFTKRILIVDDDPDITFTFKKGLEAENEYSSGKIFFCSRDFIQGVVSIPQQDGLNIPFLFVGNVLD